MQQQQYLHQHHHVNNNPVGGPIQGVGGPPFIIPSHPQSLIQNNLSTTSNSNGVLLSLANNANSSSSRIGLGFSQDPSSSSSANNIPAEQLLLHSAAGPLHPLAYQNQFAALKQQQQQQQQQQLFQQQQHQLQRQHHQRQYDHYHYGLPVSGGGGNHHSIGLKENTTNQLMMISSYQQLRMKYPGGSFERRNINKQHQHQQRIVQSTTRNFDQVNV
jgi:hypothetical protein